MTIALRRNARTVPAARRALPYTLAPAFHPAGNADSPTAPGTFTVTLTVDYANPPTLSSAAFAASLRGVLADTSLFPQGGVELTGSPIVSTTGRPTDSLTASATVRVTSAITPNALRTAMARAVFWATTLTSPNGQPIARDPNDGGSSITRALAGSPSGQVVRASFDSRLLAAAPSIVALPTTPPPGPVAPPPVQITVPALGVRSGSLTRPQIVRFQQILTAAGYDTRGIDGGIGPNTRAAVTAFQRAWQVGNRALGERTIAFLAATESLGIDGDLGPKTQRALTWLATPTAEGGGGLAVGAAPAPTATTPAQRPPATSGGGSSTSTGSGTGGSATRPPATSGGAQTTQTTQASMGGGTIAVFAFGAALVGVGIAYRDKLFGRAKKARGAIAARYKASRGSRG